MKSIPQIAEELDISSGTIREYLKRFEEFFPDPVEHEGVKEYPPETSELITKIYGYYQNSGMTKEEIRIKLGGAMALEANPELAALQAQAVPMDMGQFDALGERIEKLTIAVENLTAVFSGGNTNVNTPKKNSEYEKVDEINAQITDILELTKESDPKKTEENVLNADGTVIFSFGKLSINAENALQFSKANKRPWLHIDLETEKSPARAVRTWIAQSDISVLNVAGRSASKVPGLKKTVNDIIASLLNQ
ncbi:MAG: MerR family transcriptional regulator [Desulfobacteraceae bacterium]|nr:MerR family transcriptional regulator [Desulfobacteraceae bacterium]